MKISIQLKYQSSGSSTTHTFSFAVSYLMIGKIAVISSGSSWTDRYTPFLNTSQISTDSNSKSTIYTDSTYSYYSIYRNSNNKSFTISSSYTDFIILGLK